MIISAITNGITKVFAILMDPSLKPLLLWKIKYDDDGDHDDDNDDDYGGVYLKAVDLNLCAKLQIIKSVNLKYL